MFSSIMFLGIDLDNVRFCPYFIFYLKGVSLLIIKEENFNC